MMFSQFRQNRLAELINEQWGAIRIPDLVEVYRTALPERVLEIGSYRGVSTEFWALTCSRVVSIDPSPDMAIRRELQARLGHYPHVQLVQWLSPLLTDEMLTLPFDLIYLDGDHSYEHVKEELAFYLPHVAKGGWIGGHDYTDTPAPGDGVKQAVDEAFGIPPFVFSDGSWLVNVEDVR